MATITAKGKAQSFSWALFYDTVSTQITIFVSASNGHGTLSLALAAGGWLTLDWQQIITGEVTPPAADLLVQNGFLTVLEDWTLPPPPLP